MTDKQQEQAIVLLNYALKAIRNLKPKHSVTSMEMEIEEFLQQVEEDDNPFK